MINQEINMEIMQKKVDSKIPLENPANQSINSNQEFIIKEPDLQNEI